MRLAYVLMLISVGCSKHAAVAVPPPPTNLTNTSFTLDEIGQAAKAIYVCGKARGIAETLERTGPPSLAREARELSDGESCKAADKLIEMLDALGRDEKDSKEKRP